MDTYDSNEKGKNTHKPSSDAVAAKSNRKGWIALAVNIGLMILVGIILVWLTLRWLDVYTNRNAVIEVPDIVGMSVTDAEEVLQRDRLTIMVSDSVYNDNAKPGEVVESTPEPGSKIKKGRKIFVIINSYSTRTNTIPKIHEVSMRQALAMLKAVGFESVTVRYVGGPYNDLALYVKTTGGKVLDPGDQVPYNTPLVLEVSSNDPSLMLGADSLSVETPQIDPQVNENENWF